jgi:RNA polymerase sigma-70 factor, ECF subfamily
VIEEHSLAWPLTETPSRELDLAALVETYSTLLFRVAYSILRNRAEAEDTVQDTFVRVLQHRGTLPAVRELRPWLVRITWNLALDRRRRIRPEQMDPTLAANLFGRDTPADQALADAQQIHAVFSAIDKLPALERQVLLLSALDELDTTEIAAITGKSESAVRSLLFRARTHLRTRIEKGGHIR